MTFYDAGRTRGQLRPRHRDGRSAPCWSARSSSSASSAIRRARRRARPIASATSSSRRGCRSSCGAASPTTSCWRSPAEGSCASPPCSTRQVRRMLRRSAGAGAGRQLRRPVAAPPQPAEHDARPERLPGLRRQPAAGVRARDRAVRRQRHREDRSVLDLHDRRLHLRQRAAGPALRHPERLRHRSSAGSR